MNDRFRFRAYNRSENYYIYDAIYAYDGNNYNAGGDNDSHIRCLAEYMDRPDEYIVEQCTGLKDKNGRLIYEGDIVRLTRRKDNILQKRGSCFQIRYLTHRFCGFGYGVNNRSVDMCLTESKAKCLEVIGNIHENPELLEGGK